MKTIYKITDAIIFSTMLFITILTAMGAIFRYSLSISLPGQNELILIGAIWVYFVGLIGSASKDDHIRGGILDLINNRIILKASNITSNIVYIAFSLYCCFLSYKLLLSYIKHGYSTVYYQVPLSISIIPIFISFVFCVFSGMVFLKRSIRQP